MVVHRSVGHLPRAIGEVVCPAAQLLVQPIAHFVPGCRVGGYQKLPRAILETLHALPRRARARVPVTILPIAVRAEAVAQEVEVLLPCVAHGRASRTAVFTSFTVRPSRVMTCRV